MPGSAETALDVVGVVTAGTGLWRKATDDDPNVLDLAISTGKLAGRVADLMGPMVPFLQQQKGIIDTTTILLSFADALRASRNEQRTHAEMQEMHQRLVAVTIENAELLAAHGVT